MKNNDGETPLMQAIYNDNESVFDYLINTHANLDVQEKNGYTALFHAAGSLNIHYLKTLVDRGCDLNIQSSDVEDSIALKDEDSDDRNSRASFYFYHPDN